jgi:hypothetical protein
VRIDGRTVELAARVPGARVVELAPVADAAYVAAAITDALGVAFDEGETAREALLRHLAARQMLRAGARRGAARRRAARTRPQPDHRLHNGRVCAVPGLRLQIDRFRVVQLARRWGCSTNLHL